MSGHSKWHNIQKRKGAVDAKRASIFTKLSKAITVAAKEGGDDLGFNFSLRMAVDAAKAANMPKDKIEKAIERGAGGSGADELKEVVYEGFGPGGIALLVKCLTDNPTRTVANVKHIANKNDGSIGSAGSTMWMFERKGVVAITDLEQIEDKEAFELAVIDAGAEDILTEDELVRLICEVSDLNKLVDAIAERGIRYEGADIEYIPKTPVALDDKAAKEKLDALVERLEDDDDVDSVYTNEA